MQLLSNLNIELIDYGGVGLREIFFYVDEGVVWPYVTMYSNVFNKRT